MSLQFYSQIVPINKSLHQQWVIKPNVDAGFSRNAHVVLALITEFAQLSHEYPIVFMKNGDQVSPVAMLGIREGENLFVDNNGKWDARYIPAYVRRYPFTFTEAPEGKLLLSIDAAYAGLSKTGGEGARLFDLQGKESDFLQNMLKFAQQFQEGYVSTLQFGKELNELGLLKEMDAQMTLSAGGKYKIQGFYLVDEEKLRVLGAETLVRILKNGMLGAIYAHLLSLDNFNGFIAKLARQGEQLNGKKH
jgi:hypothetical protein